MIITKNYKLFSFHFISLTLIIIIFIRKGYLRSKYMIRLRTLEEISLRQVLNLKISLFEAFKLYSLHALISKISLRPSL